MNAIKLLYHFAVWPFESKVFKTNRIHSYYSRRYKKRVTVPIGFKCDGSTWSPNIGWSWLFHDWLFANGKFDDGTPCKWRQAELSESGAKELLIKLEFEGEGAKAYHYGFEERGFRLGEESCRELAHNKLWK